MRQIILATALALGLAGCASGGNQVLKTQDAATVDQQIVDGKTTKADLRKVYGDPNQTSFTDGGNEIWTYTYASATAMPQNFIPLVGIFAGGTNVEDADERDKI